MRYKPLPKGLTLGESEIHDIGLFAKENLGEGTNLGMSHVELGKLMLRTPMGGFINHSSKPNCIKIKSLLTRQQWNSLNDLSKNKYDHDFPRWDLVTIKDIEKGEELTVRYTFYTI